MSSIDPTFFEIPADLASQQTQAVRPPNLAPPALLEEVNPEFLAALPSNIPAEHLAQTIEGLWHWLCYEICIFVLIDSGVACLHYLRYDHAFWSKSLHFIGLTFDSHIYVVNVLL